jgi:oxygen-independent coproporphyrinogen-3 oxidase
MTAEELEEPQGDLLQHGDLAWRPVWKHPPRALYVHVPFCRRRCGYCNFTLVANRADLIDAYLLAMRSESDRYDLPCEVETIFVGGGTPSQVRGRAWDTLATLIDEKFPRAAGAEWSVEVNPEDVDIAYLRQLRDAGVTRVSLGVQSFSRRKLKVLEREHTPIQARRAIEWALDTFESVGVDLIFAAPGETLSEWSDDLEAAIQTGVPHLSTYGLTYEQGAAFWGRRRRGAIAELPEQTELEMYQTAIDTLTASGHQQYEVSNFSQAGKQCRHNEVYWMGGTYHALGAGAARHLNGRRETNHRSTTRYLQLIDSGASVVGDVDEVESHGKAVELLIFGLRRLAGISRMSFRQNSGHSMEDVAGEFIADACANGWLEDDGSVVRLTRAGLVISDSLWSRLLSA